MKYSLSRDTALTTTILEKIFELNVSETANHLKLADYYNGKHAILSRTNEDPTKPNHKIVNPYPQYITDTLCGYFVGEPIVYTSADEDLAAELSAINIHNDVASVDSDIAKTQSVYGKAYEFHYIDDEGQPRFIKQNPENIVIITDDTVEEKMLYGVRVIPQYDIIKNKRYHLVDVYSDAEVQHYTADDNLKSLKLLGTDGNPYGLVPLVEYLNNEEEIGDFETLLPLIDAYDTLESDALNDFDYFVDCYLTLRGFTADKSDIQQMKEDRVILLDEDGEASWLIKSENDTVSENLKNRFKSDIHKFAKVPDLSDENFSGNSSGVAMKYKLFGTETVTANKERYFRKGLARRFQLLAAIMNLKNGSYDWKAIEVQFTRNIPTNDTEAADLVQKLQGIVSTETLLAQLPFITDVDAEVERLDADVEKNPFYDLNLEMAKGDE